MEILAVSGKGGVGKTTVAASLALDFADLGERTLLVDCDKRGKAITRTFSPEGKLQVPRDYGVFFPVEVGNNLFGAAILDYKFDSLPRGDSEAARDSGLSRSAQFKKYMGQFPGEYGIGAFNDMMSTFFGVNSNPDQSLEFVMLSQILLGAKDKGIERVVLDLEPTRGTSRLLNNVGNAARTLKAMSEYGFLTLSMVSAKFPDVRKFLDSDYIENAALYGGRMMDVAKRIAGAQYLLVCGPESAKVDEMLLDTEPIVRSFGGKIDGYVINDIRGHAGEEGESQDRQISRVEEAGEEKGISVAKIEHDSQICIDRVKDLTRRGALSRIGRDLTLKLHLN